MARQRDTHIDDLYFRLGLDQCLFRVLPLHSQGNDGTEILLGFGLKLADILSELSNLGLLSA